MRYGLFFFILFAISCTYNELTPIPVCNSDNPSFSICVKPIIDNNCVSCHSSSSVNGDLSDYASIKQYIDSEELLERIQRDENEAGFMPLGSSRLNQQKIDLLIKWKNNGAPNN